LAVGYRVEYEYCFQVVDSDVDDADFIEFRLLWTDGTLLDNYYVNPSCSVRKRPSQTPLIPWASTRGNDGQDWNQFGTAFKQTACVIKEDELTNGDEYLVVQNPLVRAPLFSFQIFRQDILSSNFTKTFYYRPIQMLSYAIDYRLWGMNPSAFHFTNILVHFLNVLLGCAGIEGGSNVSMWCNKEFNSQIQQAKRVPEMNKRIPFYQKAQEIFKKEAPWVPIAHSIIYRAMSSNVSGYLIDPLGGDNFSGIELK